MKTDLMPFWVWDEQLETALEKIAGGSTSDGYIVLSHFVHKVETGQVPDPRSLKFIVEAFKKILAARDAGKEVEYENIFGMPMAHSRPPLTMKGSYDRALKYGSEVSKLMESGDTNLKAIAPCVRIVVASDGLFNPGIPN